MRWFKPKNSLDGIYSGVRDAGLRFQFDFKRNGTYTYSATQSGQAWEMHLEGTFKIKCIPAKSTVHYPQYEITFDVTRQYGDPPPICVSLLRSRDLLSGGRSEYMLHWPTRENDPYILFVPKHKSANQRGSWMIQPAQL